MYHELPRPHYYITLKYNGACWLGCLVGFLVYSRSCLGDYKMSVNAVNSLTVLFHRFIIIASFLQFVTWFAAIISFRLDFCNTSYNRPAGKLYWDTLQFYIDLQL